MVDVHLVNHPEARVTFRDLRSTLAGKIVTLRGQAVRVSPASYLATTLQFTCDRCATPQTIYVTNGLYDEPESCAAPGCRSKKFTPDRDSVKCADWQRIRLQELIEDVRRMTTTTPRAGAVRRHRSGGDAGEQVRTRG